MVPTTRDEPDGPASSRARQIARAACAFERQRTGQVPRSVTVVLSDDTLVITLHGVLSPAERELARSTAGAAKVQEFHRELFLNSCAPLRQAIERITGVEVREATTDVETATGTVVQVFSTGTAVQVFLLASHVEADTWGGSDGQPLAAMAGKSKGNPPPEVAVGVHDAEVTPGADKGTEGRPPDPERDLREGRWLDDGGQG